MRRGDLVIAALFGDYGKPRPCLVMQSDRLTALDSVLLCPLTGDLETTGPTRVDVAPTERNGLRKPSLIMVDKLTALPRSRCGERIGVLDPAVMEQVEGLLVLALGFLD